MRPFDAAAFQSARRGAYGADLRWLAGTSSTQDAARDAAAQGAGEGCVVLAEEQWAGRGRWGRSWTAGAGAGLLFTVLLGPGPDPKAAGLPVALGLATVLALRGLGLAEAGLKWPNDMWWRDRKLGGLLVEQQGALHLAGCGLNVAQGEGDWPDGLRRSAVSLRQAGLNVSREAALAAVLESWERVIGAWRRAGLEGLRAELDACDALKGRDCSFATGGETLKGRVLGIHGDGALRLAQAGGGERLLHGALAMDVRPLGAH